MVDLGVGVEVFNTPVRGVGIQVGVSGKNLVSPLPEGEGHLTEGLTR